MNKRGRSESYNENSQEKKAMKINKYYFSSYSYIIDDIEKIQAVNDIYSWSYDDDLDDFTDKLDDYDDEDLYVINYRLIINLFMLSIKNINDINIFLEKRSKEKLIDLMKDTSKPQELINYYSSLNNEDFITELSKKIFIPIYIKQLFVHVGKDINLLKYIIKITKKSINKFISSYNTNLISLKTYFDLYNKKSSNKNELNDLYLYRGFNYSRYKPLLDYVDEYKTNSSIFIPCILSTSVYKHIANNFIVGDRKIIWQIKINNADFEKFKYSYINTNDTIDEINLIHTDKSIVKESEFILNYGIQLKFIKKTTINKKLPGSDEVSLIEKYHFEFLNYDTNPNLEVFNSNVDTILQNLEKIKK
jgi:hypothetical protein